LADGPFDEVLTLSSDAGAVAVELRHGDGSTSVEKYPLGYLQGFRNTVTDRPSRPD
jgi:hypothetical protein